MSKFDYEPRVRSLAQVVFLTENVCKSVDCFDGEVFRMAGMVYTFLEIVAFAYA